MVLKKWIQKGIDWLSNLILAAAGLVVLWLFLLVFVYASFRIPTDSMEPTLVPGDYVLVNKLLIGPRLFNLTEALKGKRVNIRRLPGLYDIQRNDVLVFHFPHPLSAHRATTSFLPQPKSSNDSIHNFSLSLPKPNPLFIKIFTKMQFPVFCNKNSLYIQ